LSDIRFITTSSLGDVIHHMPAVTDARRHRPDARIGWVVEEAFAPLVGLHRAVDSVVPVASRRWRSRMLSPLTWQEVGAFMRAMRAQTHDTVIDAQGLLRSALITALARGRRSEQIAAALPNAKVPDRAPLDEVARLVARASFVVGVDTGLLHLAAALGVPLVAIFLGTEPGQHGPLGSGRIEIVGALGERPS